MYRHVHAIDVGGPSLFFRPHALDSAEHTLPKMLQLN